MRQSNLFGKTSHQAPKDETSVNAQLLIKAGYISKLMSGVYSYLPLGWRVQQKIANIIREEMNALGGQEIFMPALQPKDIWVETDRWQAIDVMYRFKDQSGRELALGPTHEEIVTDLARRLVNSYRDLPFSVYQIQTKFRDEPRAKSGILRGREFIMKDLYSFHLSAQDLERFYQTVILSYNRIFDKCGIPALLVEASGGVFSKYSHEFMVATPAGEDIVYSCQNCQWAQNKEIATLSEGDTCIKCNTGKIIKQKMVEVGNIFKLGTRFTEKLNVKVKNSTGEDENLIMGCYGIGLGRVLGTIVESHHDDRGIIWPETVAPFAAHLIGVGDKSKEKIEALYKILLKNNVDVLLDDRWDMPMGSKLTDADLIGIPVRIIASDRTGELFEIKKRNETEVKNISEGDVVKMLC